MNLWLKTRRFLGHVRRNPAHAWTLLQHRLECRTGVSLWWLSPSRIRTRALERRRTLPLPPGARAYGNYFLDPARVEEGGVVVSGGVGLDVSFDRAVAERHRVRLLLVDPTPRTRRFVAGLDLPGEWSFEPVALSDRDGTIELFATHHADPEESASLSIEARGSHRQRLSVRAVRLPTLLAAYGAECPTVLKLDIEGSAPAVLRDAVAAGLEPEQLVFELERPLSLWRVGPWIGEVESLLDLLESRGYRFHPTRRDNVGFQVELLAIRDRPGSARRSNLTRTVARTRAKTGVRGVGDGS